MKEIHLSFQEKSLKIDTKCSDEIIDKIEEYININYLKHNLRSRLLDLAYWSFGCYLCNP